VCLKHESDVIRDIMNWTKRKSLLAATVASTLMLLVIACGSDPNVAPASSGDSDGDQSPPPPGFHSRPDTGR
jgi:hypothetical protein